LEVKKMRMLIAEERERSKREGERERREYLLSIFPPP
jgi:hypothetical protein